MKTVYVLCEGPTEKQFVQEVLYDVALSKNIYLLAPVVTTKVADRKYYGGTSSYRIQENQERPPEALQPFRRCNHKPVRFIRLAQRYPGIQKPDSKPS